MLAGGGGEGGGRSILQPLLTTKQRHDQDLPKTKQHQDLDLHLNPDLLRKQHCSQAFFRRETTSSNLQGFGSNIFSKISDALFGALQKV